MLNVIEIENIKGIGGKRQLSKMTKVEIMEYFNSRKHPKLSAVQKANLRALGKNDDYLELYGLT